MNQQGSPNFFWPLSSLGGVLGVVWLLLIPAEGGLLGYSLSRWLLILGVAVPSILLGTMVFITTLRDQANQWLWQIAHHRIFYPLWISAAVLVLIGAAYGIALGQIFTDLAVKAQLVRLTPIFFWVGWLSLLSLVHLPGLRNQHVAWRGVKFADVFPIGLGLMGVLGLAAFVQLTGIGLSPDRTSWETPGTPLLTTQVWLVWGIGICLYFLFSRLGEYKDVVAFLAIWLVAMVLWWNQPAAPSYFSPRPEPPNYEYYPYSDAALLAINSESLLVGEGFQVPPEKPLYNLVLAGSLWAGGHTYKNTVNILVVFLALFPALLYGLAVQMRVRLAGLIAAGLIVLRESNSIRLSGIINVSHAKLMMTDLPAALFMALFVVAMFQWAQHPDEKYRPALAGGILGLFLLIRSQVILFVPVVFLITFVIYWRSWRKLALMSSLFLGMMTLTILPWMMRNFQVTGKFGYSQPFQAGYIARQYSFTPELSSKDPSQASAGFEQAFAFMRANPGYVAGFISAHFLRNEVSSVIAFPVEFHLARDMAAYYGLAPYWQERSPNQVWADCCGLPTYIDRQPFWDFKNTWPGNWPSSAIVPLLFSLTMIGFGIGFSWKRVGWAGLIPLILHFTYSLSTAVARVSGWRLILPADWILVMYYSIGLAWLSLSFWWHITGERQSKSDPSQVLLPDRYRNKINVAALLAIAAIGLLVPLSEVLVPERYSDDALSIPDWFPTLSTEQSEGLAIFQGRALFPQYFGSGFGRPGDDYSAFMIRPYNRIGFIVVGDGIEHVVMPLDDIPDTFPNAADVVVIGCPQSDYFLAVGVSFIGGDLVLFADDPASLCQSD